MVITDMIDIFINVLNTFLFAKLWNSLVLDTWPRHSCDHVHNQCVCACKKYVCVCACYLCMCVCVCFVCVWECERDEGDLAQETQHKGAPHRVFDVISVWNTCSLCCDQSYSVFITTITVHSKSHSQRRFVTGMCANWFIFRTVFEIKIVITLISSASLSKAQILYHTDPGVDQLWSTFRKTETSLPAFSPGNAATLETIIFIYSIKLILRYPFPLKCFLCIIISRI